MCEVIRDFSLKKKKDTDRTMVEIFHSSDAGMVVEIHHSAHKATVVFGLIDDGEAPCLRAMN